MSEKNIKNNIENRFDLSWFAVGLWVLFFWGEPDIADAVIHFLMNYSN